MFAYVCVAVWVWVHVCVWIAVYTYIHPRPSPTLSASSQAPDGDPNLQLLQTVTDLLASCAEGENLFIESVCQTIYKVSTYNYI